MWRNADVLDFVGWLRSHNDRVARPGLGRVGFYGLDLYSLYASIAAVIAYLEAVDPPAAASARERYACFEQFGPDALGLRPRRAPRDHRLLPARRGRAAHGAAAPATDYLRRDGLAAEDEQFYAEQNARLVANAEEYYRSMFADHASSWNLRDLHMADTLDRLAAHLQRRGDPARIVVWEHNSHVGDARMTEMSARGELNVGQLARQRHGGDAVLVGFTTHSGTVTAASDLGRPGGAQAGAPGAS